MINDIRNTSKSETFKLTIIFIIASIIYYTTSPGAILGSNDGSQFALLKTAYENKTFILDQYINYTNMVNVAYFKDNFYSDRAPGTLIAAFPFYYLGRLLQNAYNLSGNPNFFESIPRESPDLSYAFPAFSILITASILLQSLSGALLIVVIYKTCKTLSVKDSHALVVSVLAGFGTMYWRYSTVFFSHIISGLVLALIVLFTLQMVHIKKQVTVGYLFIISFLTGYLITLEYQNTLYLPGIFIYFFMNRKLFNAGKTFLVPYIGRISIKFILIFLVGFLIPYSGLLAYHYSLFQNPFKDPYKYHYVYTWATNYKELFSGNFFEGFTGIFFSIMRDGLFVSSPFLLLGIPGLALLYKKLRKESIFFISLIFIPILVISKEKEWHGGFDPRYILPTITLLAVPISYWLTNYFEYLSPNKKTWMGYIITILGVYSVFFQINEIPQFIQRTGEYLPSNSMLMFLPNISNLYIILIVLAVIAYCVVILTNSWPRVLIGGIVTITIVLSLLSTGRANAKSNILLTEKDFFHYELFDETELSYNKTSINGAVIQNGTLQPATSKTLGSISYDFEFERPVCSFTVSPRGILVVKGDTIKVRVENSEGAFNEIYSYELKSKETSINPIIDVSSLTKGEKNFKIILELNAVRSAIDVRLTSLYFTAKYCNNP